MQRANSCPGRNQRVMRAPSGIQGRQGADASPAAASHFAAAPAGHHFFVDFAGQRLDSLAELGGQLGQFGILIQHLRELLHVLRRQILALRGRDGQVFPVLGIGLGVRLVPVGLAGLRQENQRRRIGRLETEGEIQEDEGIHVEARHPGDVDDNPDPHHDRLGDKENRGAEKARKRLGLQRKPVSTKNRREVDVRQVKAEVMLGVRLGGGRNLGVGCGGCGHDLDGWRRSS